MKSVSGVNARYSFLALDPRKTKRRMIETLLKPIGDISWRRLPPLGVAGFPETSARAEAAYFAARRQSRISILSWLQKCLYAWQYNGSRAWFARNPDCVAVAWNGLNGSRRVFMDGAKDAGARTLYFELAPFSGRVTCDPVGVNQVNSLPRTAEFYLDWMRRAAVPAGAWRSWRANIKQRAPARDKPSGISPNGNDGPYVFAPLQVPGDSQLRLFGGQFGTVPSFINALVAAADHLPTGWHLKIKEHPTAEVSFADQLVGRNSRVVLDNMTDTFTLVAAAEVVVTVNSSVGLEAMFFDKPVVACGECFWAIPGIADLAPDPTMLAAVLARPEALTFDGDARAAYLSYLIEEYYVALDGSAKEAEKVRRRLGECEAQ